MKEGRRGGSRASIIASIHMLGALGSLFRLAAGDRKSTCWCSLEIIVTFQQNRTTDNMLFHYLFSDYVSIPYRSSVHGIDLYATHMMNFTILKEQK